MVPKKDLLILSELRNNARESLTKMSRKTSIPVSTIYDKIKTYLGDIITKHTTLLDFTKLGFNARANILLKTSREQREKVREFLVKNQNVNSVFKISNGYDYMIEGVFKNVKDVEEFLETFEAKFNIEQSQVYYIIEDVKKEEFMNNNQLLELVM